ncbi:MAG: hypothetical protein ACT4TC_11045 [Myxococcaceae bacterium]
MPISFRTTLLLSAVAVSAFAADWETVVPGPITVKARAKDANSIQEIWAEGDFDVSAKAVQDVLTDDEQLRKFMPHVKEARYVLKPSADGAKFVYVLLKLPVIGQRDYVVKRKVESSLKGDGTGEFKARWEAAPGALPKRHNIGRMVANEGSWKVSPLPGGKSHIEYRAMVDPGGVPAASVNSGNRTEVPATLRAVETEAKRRSASNAGVGGAADAGK